MNRTGNYCAFYVDEPFAESNLGPRVVHDFCYYNTLKLWKANDNSFPFVNSHDKTYQVRDGSQWETLKSRIHDRLNASKNIILFLSNITKNSKALREEIEYGIKSGLPIIIVYPELSNEEIVVEGSLSQKVKILLKKLPILENNMDKILTLHIPFVKEKVEKALTNEKFTINHKIGNNQYFYKN